MSDSKNYFDGWKNILTGLGMKNRDKKMSTEVSRNILVQRDVEELYAADDVATKAVDVLPEEMFREGSEFKNEDPEKVEKLNEEYERLDLEDKFLSALKQARLYGGAGIVFGVKDGKNPDEPVDWNNVRAIEYATVLHRHELNYQKVETDISSPYFGKPSQYSITNNGGMGILVHRSRMIIFDGETLPKDLYKENSYWHDSVLTKVEEDIKGFSSTYHKIYSLLEDFDQGVYKVKDLAKYVAAGKNDLVLKRLQMIDMKRSMIKSIVVDADGEDFERKSTSFQGVPEILDRIAKRIGGALNIPHTKLLGEGATGNLGGQGESEMKEWYDFVKRNQEKTLDPAFKYVNKLITTAKQGPFKGNEETFAVKHRPLKQLTKKEQAEVQKLTSEADNLNIMNGVYTADEAAISRYAGDEFSVDITLSEDIDRGVNE